MRQLFAALFLLSASPLFAADAPQPVVAIRAARLIDGRGGKIVSPAVIVVRGNKIESIVVPFPPTRRSSTSAT